MLLLPIAAAVVVEEQVLLPVRQRLSDRLGDVEPGAEVCDLGHPFLKAVDGASHSAARHPLATVRPLCDH